MYKNICGIVTEEKINCECIKIMVEECELFVRKKFHTLLTFGRVSLKPRIALLMDIGPS